MRQKGFALIVILGLIVLGAVGFFGYKYLHIFTSVTTQSPSASPVQKSALPLVTSNPTTQPTISGIVTGKVLILRMDENTMNVQFIAESAKSNITQMMVWTDTNTNKQWQEFSTLLTIPVSENVYVKYRDNLNNESEMYTDTTIPPQGPPQ